MRLLEHEDLLHLARLAIRTGFQYHREAERVQLDEVFAYTPKNFSETYARSSVMKKAVSAMLVQGERTFRQFVEKHYPDTTVIFAHDHPPGTKEELVTITPETLLIQLIGGKDQTLGGLRYGISIHIALIRNGQPSEGICHHPFYDTTMMTWDDEAFIFHTKNKLSVQGEYEPLPMKVRSVYSEEGFPEELRKFRPVDFYEQNDYYRTPRATENVAEQIISIATGCAECTHQFTAYKPDMAAAHAVLLKSGGRIVGVNGQEITYENPLQTVTGHALDASVDLQDFLLKENPAQATIPVPEAANE